MPSNSVVIVLVIKQIGLLVVTVIEACQARVPVIVPSLLSSLVQSCQLFGFQHCSFWNIVKNMLKQHLWENVFLFWSFIKHYKLPVQSNYHRSTWLCIHDPCLVFTYSTLGPETAGR